MTGKKDNFRHRQALTDSALLQEQMTERQVQPAAKSDVEDNLGKFHGSWWKHDKTLNGGEYYNGG